MVRRGILAVLVGLVWVAGAAALWQHWQGLATLSTQSVSAVSTEGELEFPFAIPNTPLVALSLTSYDGVYWEDGSVEEVTSIAAIILRNDGPELLQKAKVELWQKDRALHFDIDYLPAGEQIMVLEQGREDFSSAPITACTGEATAAAKDIPGLVTIRETQGKYLLITNPGPIPLQNITLYYKTYDHEQEMFLGGIAYEIFIYRIAPGETYFSRPEYYTSGESRIVKIKTSGG